MTNPDPEAVIDNPIGDIWPTVCLWVWESHDDVLLPVPDSMMPQTKVPIYGRDHISSRKAQAMKQAKDRKKQLARVGPNSNLNIALHGPEKLEPEFVRNQHSLITLLQALFVFRPNQFWLWPPCTTEAEFHRAIFTLKLPHLFQTF